MAIAAAGFVAAPLLRNEQRIGPAGIVAALPMFAVGLYLFVGSPQAAGIGPPTHNPIRQGSSASPTTRKSVGSIASLVAGLAERVDKNPEDGKSWLLLARSYKHLQRIPDAIDAYQHAALLGEYDEELASIAVSTTAAAPEIQVTGRVELAREAEHLTQANDIVFIFARAIGGPSMPVAVLRKQASELPFDFKLSDSHSMSAAATLSDFERVVVTARISRAGDTRNALRELEAQSEELVLADHNSVSLIIEKQDRN
jgi:hypothetical protein